MKKIFLGVVIFAIVSVSVTGILIDIKKESLNTNDVFSGEKVDTLVSENENISEKTIDLYGKYDENDLIIEKKTIKTSSGNFEIKIPQIKGLKNKTIENKVNKDIKDRIFETIGKFASNNEVKNVNSYYEMTGNFSNVISGYWHISYEDTSRHEEEVYINYELVNGEKLKIEDLFVKDMDFNTLIRKIIYKIIDNGTLGRTTYYDKEKQAWMSKYYLEEGTFTEYVPNRTEEYSNKIMKKFMGEKEKAFYFSPTRIYIVLDDEDSLFKYAYYNFKDIANEVTIYNKYLTQESIYEYQNIGKKEIWTCSQLPYDCYTEYGFAAENLYYEISKEEYGYDTIMEGDERFQNYQDLKKKLTNKVIKSAQEKVEEYKKIAINNPEEFYILYLRYEVKSGVSLNTRFDYSNENEIPDSEKTISEKIYEFVTTTNITNKQRVMEELINCYRYYKYRYGKCSF